MPYSKKSDAPDWVADDKKMQWVEVWNSVYKAKKKEGMSNKDAEAAAFKQAGGVVSDKKEINMENIERRYCSELRIESQGDEMAIGGYAALFNTVSHNLGGFKEKIAPGAFARSLGEGADVKALFNHDPSRILGRIKNGSLSVQEDERGLKWRAVLNPVNPDHKALYENVKSNLISDCSFAFTVASGGDDWQEESGNEDWFAMRTLKDVNLMDVSAVTWPAYPGTSVGARAENLTAEVRMRVDAFKNKRAAKPGMPEKRDDDSDESLEEMCREVSVALAEKFPYPSASESVGVNYGKYWVIETHADYLIVCTAGESDEYFKISYHEDEANETFLFGEPQPVEKEWVPSERSKKAVGEARACMAGLMEEHKKAAAALAEQSAAAAGQAQAHTEAAAALAKAEEEKKAYREDYGLLPDEEYEENNMVDPEDVWALEGSTDPDDEGGDTEEAKLRKATRLAEMRAKGKVRTKKVGGKNLPASKFAFVGDPEKTETWKLPIHDADHVRNALARFGQTQGIPAGQKDGVYRKIKAAAKAFGIEVSDETSRAIESSLPMSDDEIADKLRRARAAMVEL